MMHMYYNLTYFGPQNGVKLGTTGTAERNLKLWGGGGGGAKKIEILRRRNTRYKNPQLVALHSLFRCKFLSCFAFSHLA